MVNKIIKKILLVLLFSGTILGCQVSGEVVENNDVLFQYSTLGALLEGVYDGEMTYAEIKQHGVFDDIIRL